jgi:hypothetical protein
LPDVRSVDQRAAIQASNPETVREFGKKHGRVLIRLLVSNGANVLGRQKDCQANVCCRAIDFEGGIPEEGINKTFNFFEIPPCGISG